MKLTDPGALQDSSLNKPDNSFDFIHSIFGKHAKEDPSKIAIFSDETSTTREALNFQSDLIAHNLIKHGVSPNDTVGVLVDRSAHLPHIFLGILKANAVYVPIVADHPGKRLAQMVKQANIRTLVLLDNLVPANELKDAIKQLNGQIYDFDFIAQDHGNGVSIPKPKDASDLAAILFTSGSTGLPKGVMIQYAAIFNMVSGHMDIQDICPNDRILLSSSPGFILGFRELCLPLISGGAYVPAIRNLLDTPKLLLDYMERHSVTVALFTPSYLHLLGGRITSNLRCIMTAGERPNLADALEYAKHIDYWNMHGATEVCGTFCLYKVEANPLSPITNIPSGRPFPNINVFVLDESQNIVPPGEIGQIYVTGISVSPGYVNDQVRSEESFFNTQYGYAYKTGDLGLWNSDGYLETFGRSNDVIKVSGQSVALGEVESALLRHPDIRHATALQSSNNLIGFVVSDNKNEINLIEFLGEFLPRYMIPAKIYSIEKIPTTSAGKADRLALLSIAEKLNLNREYRIDELPQGEFEQSIASVWEDVLKTKPVLRDDNFYSLGGTSLNAIEISIKLQSIGYPIRAQDLLTSLTISGLASLLSELRNNQIHSIDQANLNSGLATKGHEDFWVAAGLELPSAAAHILKVIDIIAPQDSRPTIESLQEAWAKIISHHAALRTQFFTDPNGKLHWQINDSPDLLAHKFLHNYISDQKSTSSFIESQLNLPFDLTRAPLARAGLIEVNDENKSQIIWMVFHHSVIDGASATQIISDFLSITQNKQLSKAVNGTFLASDAERQYFASHKITKDHSYWHTLLENFASPPLDENSPGPFDGYVPDFSFNHNNFEATEPLSIRLSHHTREALQKIGRQYKAGLHSILLALLGFEVQRRTARRKLIIGSGVSLRPVGAEESAGLFVNVLPMALDVESPQNFATWILKSQNVLTEAMLHASYPGSLLARDFLSQHPELRSTQSGNLFDVTLTPSPIHNYVNETHFKAHDTSAYKIAPPLGVDFSFSYSVHNDTDDLQEVIDLNLQWNAALYEKSTAQKWLNSFAGWANWLAEDISRAEIAPPKLFPNEEILLRTLDYGPIIKRPAVGVHQLVLDWAITQPDAPAVISTEGIQTYAQLLQIANSVAASLANRDLGSHKAIAVLTDCCSILPGIILGIWKAGGVYVPLTRELPSERMRFMVEDVDARILINTDSKEDVPKVLSDQIKIILDANQLNSNLEPSGEKLVSPDDIACIFYTSGTTGQPKGVLLSHRGLVNTALSFAQIHQFSQKDRNSLVATPTFDASMWELLMTLVVGGTVVPINKVLRDDPWELKRYYSKMGVTVAFHVPSYLRTSQETPFIGLQLLMTGGEAPNHADAHFHAPPLKFWNAYGPTETSLIISMGAIDALPDRKRPLHAGKPLPNTSISLRRQDGTLVPPGEIGELWLGGIGLAVGYLNSPDLSAKSFVTIPEGRFYRTGDQGRWTPSGNIELFGRIDQQVKLRGQRIELGEIEEALQSHPAIRQVAVLADSSPGQMVLRAFICLNDDSAIRHRETWDAWLAPRLPKHMIPASFKQVTNIPVKPNGKINAPALLALNSFDDEDERTQPESELEKIIAEIWGALLVKTLPNRSPLIAREDNFFALGGNSLLAVTMAHRLGLKISCNIQARDLFVAPTLAQFAASLEKQSDSKLVSNPEELIENLATVGESEFYVAEMAGLDTRHFNIPLMRKVNGEVPPQDAWRKAWNKLVSRHPALRSWFELDDHHQLQRYISAPEIPIIYDFDFSEVPDRAAAISLIRTRQSINLSMGKQPPWRVGLVKSLDGSGSLFWLILHHSLGDGHSVATLTSELASLLRGERLDPIKGNLVDFSKAEKKYFNSTAFDEDALFWRDTLLKVSDDAYKDWPLDHPRRIDSLPGCHRQEVMLDESQTRSLRDLAKRYNASFHALLLTILANEVHRRIRRNDMILGTTSTLRDDTNTLGAVGYAVNMLPLPFHIKENDSFTKRLDAMQEILSKSLHHGRYPFAKIYHQVWQERPYLRDPARFPLFDIAITENPISTEEVTEQSLSLDRPTPVKGSVKYNYELTGHSPGQDMVLVYEPLNNGGLMLQLQMNSALFDRDSAQFWLNGLYETASWLAEDIDRAKLNPPSIFPTEESTLHDWSWGSKVDRKNKLLHEIVEDLAADQDNHSRPALIDYEGREISYGLLAKNIHAISSEILSYQLEVGSVVAVLTPRSSIELPAAILGIWKAGCIYLPLASELPPERLSFIASDSDAKLLIALNGISVPSELKSLPLLRPGSVNNKIIIDKDYENRRNESAYIIYTSGSTGKPKGTLVSHKSYMNTILSTGEAFELNTEDRSLLFASPAFDVSLLDIGVPLAFGSAACEVPPDVIEHPSSFISLLRARKITIADITPSYLRLLGNVEVPSLRILVTGGETPIYDDIKRYSHKLRYYNAYGPTENAITSTMGLIQSSSSEPIVLAGRPLPNTCVEIRSENGELNPPGALGEVWLGGLGLADGYINLPEITSNSFIDTLTGRRYKTGDIGRWRHKAISEYPELEILGRVDQQVKLGGIRIELGEIEQALAQSSEIGQAVVLLEKDKTSGEARESLWAFVTPEKIGQPISYDWLENGWRNHLKQTLPSFMIPAGVIPIEKIPVTNSGKVDKEALRVILSNAKNSKKSTSISLPQGKFENEVAEIWKQLLGTDLISRDDNFFELGGNSLLAIELSNRLEKDHEHFISARELFVNPTLSDFARRVEKLSKNLTSDLKLESDIATTSEQDFWAAEAIGFDTRAFNMSLTLEVKGLKASNEMWINAWVELIKRHGVLRCHYVEELDGTLKRSVILPESLYEFATEHFHFQDIKNADPLPYINKKRLQKISMGDLPLWKAGLIHSENFEQDNKAIFWIILHHSISDAASLAILTDEIQKIMQGETLGPVTRSLSQSSAKEQKYLSENSAQEDCKYWLDILDQAIMSNTSYADNTFDEWRLDYPRKLERSTEKSKGIHVFTHQLDLETSKSLEKIAKNNKTSIHAIMAALLAIEIRRRTGRSQFIIGTAVSTRETYAESQAIGCYVNMIPLVFDLTDVTGAVPTTIAETISITRTILSEGLIHSRYPTTKIINDFRRKHQPEVTLGRHPLFDFVLTENPADENAPIKNGDTFYFSPYSSNRSSSSNYQLVDSTLAQDITLTHQDDPNNGRILKLLTNAAIYSEDSARDWANGFVALVKYFAKLENLNIKIPNTLPEENVLLESWGKGSNLEINSERFDHLFLKNELKYPDRPALISTTGTKSYREVKILAMSLAMELQAHGVIKGDHIGVFSHRSESLPIAALSVWMAGCCYVPLSADLPEERLSFIARNADIRFLIVLDELKLPTSLLSFEFDFLRPEQVWSDTNPHLTGDLNPNQSNKEDLACILYTSGSTGTPKGVALRHEGILNLGLGTSHIFNLTADDRVLQMSAPSFDLWLSDLVMTWSSGAALVPLKQEYVHNIPDVLRILDECEVSVATMTPSYLRLFDKAKLSGIRLLMTVGEPPILSDAEHYSRQLEYFNGYGPTENTAATSIGSYKSGSLSIDAGRPSPNIDIHILDTDAKPVPPGAIGEIWVSGLSLAAGYQNRRSLTKQFFVTTENGRRYRTGDLGRWKSQGNLEVLNRVDTQIKLRGQRIELSEIESALQSHQSIKQAVVLIEKALDGSEHLNAFVSLKKGLPKDLDSSEETWKAYLSSKLPSYMIPKVIVPMDIIPMSPSGKVDRTSLQNTLRAQRRNESYSDNDLNIPDLLPQGDIECRIAEIWCKILGLNSVGRHDNFFNIGGDSLRATMMVSLVRKEYKCNFELFYENPCLSDFAAQCIPQAANLTSMIEIARKNWLDYKKDLGSFDKLCNDSIAAQKIIYETRYESMINKSYRAKQNYRNVLLTGATGYLGAYLLRELLNEPSRQVSLLIRANNAGDAASRLFTVISHYFGSNYAKSLINDRRISIYSGDLSKKNLGLSRDDYQKLSSNLHAIIHSAANTNHYGNYNDIYANNVFATEYLLDLAKNSKNENGKTVDFHFISTLSVFGKSPENSFKLFTEYDNEIDPIDENLYIRSKQEAEKLVIAARDHLTNACIHRTGNISFATNSNILQLDIRRNHFFRLLKSISSFGYIEKEMATVICHVDIVAQSIIQLAQCSDLINETHHIENSRAEKIVDLIHASSQFKEKLQCGDYGELLNHLVESLNNPKLEADISELLNIFGIYQKISPHEIARRLVIASDRTQLLLNDLGVHWPNNLPNKGAIAFINAIASDLNTASSNAPNMKTQNA